MTSSSSIQLNLSFGEFLDKITILEIKAERITDPAKLANVRHELTMLRELWQAHEKSKIDIRDEYAALKAINEKLWTIEDDIRDKERAKEFDAGFIQLARDVYFNNDERANIKRIINEKLGSELIEEKSYADYT